VAEHLLVAEELGKTYGDVVKTVALSDVAFALERGEFASLVGQSGSGKSTLLNLIGLLDTPTTGRVALDDHETAALGRAGRARLRNELLGFVFQFHYLLPEFSVIENVLMPGLIGRGAEKQLRPRAEEVLALLGLEGLEGKNANQLSGGQKQRVALARALVKRPRLLLLDEPLGALDRKLREQMQIELKRLQRETGIAFLVVTHDQEEALTMADRIALLNHGRIAQLGEPRLLYEQPNSRFVADFIGQMNFIDGVRRAEGFEMPGIGLRGAANLDDVPIGAVATLAVRPERVEVGAAAVADGVEATVEGMAYHGQDLILHVRMCNNEAPLVARLPAVNADSTHLSPGSRVWCRWPVANSRILSG
jgi:ABC-type Fe3+/spermidine/putrescine transport system ATPase subunit